jgi:hypothetical protein
MKQKVQTKHCVTSRDLVLIIKKQMARERLNIARSLSRFWDFVLASPRPGAIDSRVATSQPVQSELRPTRSGFVDPPPYSGPEYSGGGAKYRPLPEHEHEWEYLISGGVDVEAMKFALLHQICICGAVRENRGPMFGWVVTNPGSPSPREAQPAIGSEPSQSNETYIPGEANK